MVAGENEAPIFCMRVSKRATGRVSVAMLIAACEAVNGLCSLVVGLARTLDHVRSVFEKEICEPGSRRELNDQLAQLNSII